MSRLKKSQAAMWATIIVILAGALAWAGYTAYAATDPYADNTISNGLLLIQLVFPVVTAVLGVVAGHWTWPRPAPVGPEVWSVSILAILLVGQAMATNVLQRVPMPLIFAFNYILGHFLWPQSATTIENARRILPFVGS